MKSAYSKYPLINIQYYLIIIFLSILIIKCIEDPYLERNEKLSILQTNEVPTLKKTYDSLMLNLEIEKATKLLIDKYSNDLPKELELFVSSKLVRNKLHYYWLFDEKIFPNLDYDRVLPEDKLYVLLNTDPDRIDPEELKYNLSTAKHITHKIDALNQITYYYDAVQFNIDSSYFYNNAARSLLIKFEAISYLHLDCYLKSVLLYSYRRKNLHALVDIDKLISSLNRQNNKIVEAKLYNTRSLIQSRLGNKKLAKKDSKIAQTLLSENQGIAEYQNYLKNQIYAHIHEKTEELKFKAEPILNYLDSLYRTNVQITNKDYYNYNRIRGQVLSSYGKFNEANEYWARAVDYDLNKVPFKTSTYYSSAWYYSQSLEKLNKPDEALAVYLSKLDKQHKRIIDESDIIGNKINSLYTFIDSERISSIYYNKFKLTGNLAFLKIAIQILEEAHKQIYLEISELNEQSTLTLYKNKADLINVSLNMIYELYIDRPDDELLNKFFVFASGKKNMLFERDLNLSFISNEINDKIGDSYYINKMKIDSINLDYRNNWIELNHQLNIQDSLHKKVSQLYDTEIQRIGSRKSLAQIQSSLDENSSILDFYITKGYLYTLLINKNKCRLERKQFTTYHKDLINNFFQQNSDIDFSDIRLYEKSSNELFNFLIGKTIYIELKQNLYISPDNLLHKINFETLVTNTSESAKYFKDLDYLLYNHEVIYTPSLITSKLDIDLTDLKNQSTNIAAFNFSDKSTIVNNNANISELPYSEFETDHIKKTYNNSRIYSGSNATKDNFLSELQNPENDIVHVSIHGKSNTETTNDIALYFRTPEKGLDSLQNFELYKINSTVKHINLNACESGIGNINNEEGMFSLVRTFLQIGAKSVNASLWNLDSRTSYILTKECLINNSSCKATLLRNGKIKDHPYYWGSSTISIN